MYGVIPRNLKKNDVCMSNHLPEVHKLGIHTHTHTLTHTHTRTHTHTNTLTHIHTHTYTHTHNTHTYKHTYTQTHTHTHTHTCKLAGEGTLRTCMCTHKLALLGQPFVRGTKSRMSWQTHVRTFDLPAYTVNLP